MNDQRKTGDYQIYINAGSSYTVLAEEKYSTHMHNARSTVATCCNIKEDALKVEAFKKSMEMDF